MKKSKFISAIFKEIKKSSPEILTAIGITGMIGSTIMAVKATPKAMQLIEERSKEFTLEKMRNEDLIDEEAFPEKLPVVEVIKTAWKCYIPVGITAGVSIICLIGASSENYKRNAALTTLYTFTETTLKDYQEKVVEVIGEEKESAIKDSVSQKRIDRQSNNIDTLIVGEGDTLCFEPISSRYFMAEVSKLKEAEAEMNRQLIRSSYVTLNDLYYAIGLEGTRFGDNMGWFVDGTMNHSVGVEFIFRSTVTKDLKPCLVLDYKVPPEYSNSDFYPF